MVLNLQPGQRKLPLKAIFRKLDQEAAVGYSHAPVNADLPVSVYRVT